MPTVIYIDGFWVMVLTLDHPPPDVHVSKAGKKAKVYLGSLDVEGATRFSQPKSARPCPAA